MTQALLLLDINNATVAPFGAEAGYLDTVIAAQERAEQAGVLVVLVRVAFRPGHPAISQRNKAFAAIKASGGLVHGHPDVEPHPRLLRGERDIVVTRKRLSAFTGSDLDLVLRSNNVTTVVLAGITTSGVVLSTLRDAADRDYEITVLQDLCLDTDDEVQRVLMEKVFPIQAEVMSSVDWRTE